MDLGLQHVKVNFETDSPQLVKAVQQAYEARLATRSAVVLLVSDKLCTLMRTYWSSPTLAYPQLLAGKGDVQKVCVILLLACSTPSM